MQAIMNTEEAAVFAGNSKSTILRDIKSGKLSATKKGRGWDIDPSELARVYELKIDGDASGSRQDRSHDASRRVSDASLEGNDSRALRVQLESAQLLIEERGKTIEDLRRRLDSSEEKRSEAEEERAATQRQLTALLTDQREQASQAVMEERRTHWGYWVALVLALGVVGAFAAVLYAPELFWPGG